jgi:hypothetical protein
MCKQYYSDNKTVPNEAFLHYRQCKKNNNSAIRAILGNKKLTAENAGFVPVPVKVMQNMNKSFFSSFVLI